MDYNAKRFIFKPIHTANVANKNALFIIILLSLISSFFNINLFAKEVPKLTKETVSIAEVGALNKCIHKEDRKKVIYSQFNCPDEYVLMDENWKEKTNITESTPSKKEVKVASLPFLNEKDRNDYQSGGFTRLPEGAPFSDIVNTFNEKQHKGEPIDGYEILKEAFKNKSPSEIFNESLRALMYRKQFLDSL